MDRRGLLGAGNGEAVNLLPVRMTEALAGEAGRSSGEQGCGATRGTIQVELAKGQVRISGSVEAESRVQ